MIRTDGTCVTRTLDNIIRGQDMPSEPTEAEKKASNAKKSAG